MSYVMIGKPYHKASVNGEQGRNVSFSSTHTASQESSSWPLDCFICFLVIKKKTRKITYILQCHAGIVLLFRKLTLM